MKRLVAAAALLGLPLAASAAFMDADWAKKACDAWNADPTLTQKLAPKWVGNNGGRGYKVILMYRDKCGPDSKVQLTIAPKDGKAMCVYGGKPDDKAAKFDKSMDYEMHAKDKHWACMGAGKFGCGAMGAMATGKLKFTGPKGEAMSVMGPFGRFLKLTGELGGDMSSCPN